MINKLGLGELPEISLVVELLRVSGANDMMIHGTIHIDPIFEVLLSKWCGKL